MERKVNYSFGEMLYNVICVIISKLYDKRIRILRFPITIRGKKYIDFGKKLSTGRFCQFEVMGKHNKKCLVFGKNVNIGHYVRVQCAEKINISDGVLIGSRVLIIDHSHGIYNGENIDTPYIEPNRRSINSKPIKIEKNVWIGEGVVIQQGVTIGEGAIVGANSVVTKDIPRYSIAGGVPARAIKIWNSKTCRWEVK